MRARALAVVVACVLLWGVRIGAQNTAQAASPATIQAGGALFRERCADCHGDNAKGSVGPDLTRIWTAPTSEQRALQIIRNGVPGSVMPPSSAPDDELRAVVAYLRSISTAKGEATTGDVANGERVFAAQCASCHRINNTGGHLGPDLSHIAASQANQLLIAAIRNASSSFTSGYEPVTIVTRDGQRIQGARKSEDAFSIQIMDTHERLQGYLKSNLRDVIRDRTSLMPDFGPDRLSAQDLDDVVAYLGTFRAAAPAGRGRAAGAGDNR